MSKTLSSKIHSESLVTPEKILEEFPATITQQSFIEKSREQIFRIFEGRDNRLLLIFGPCSIHDELSAIHYAEKVKLLSKEISDVFFPVMRFYFEKPRTRHGWKGIMHDPYLNGSYDLNHGLRLTRKLLLQVAEMEVATAAEILDPISVHYFGDLLSWGCVGARTASSPLHRQTASGLSLPIGFKNTTEGSVDIPINSIISASRPHTYIGINQQGMASIIHTSGNPSCHLVLRGGEKGPNYDENSLKYIIEKLVKAKISPYVLIDCSHDNSKKDHTKQVEVFENVIHQILKGNTAIRGLILESHLEAGRQEIPSNPSLLKYAISLTDPCIDWETTERIIFAARKDLLEKKSSLAWQHE